MFAGKIVPMKYAMGNIVRVKTISIYKTIQIMRSWDTNSIPYTIKLQLIRFYFGENIAND